MFSNFQNQPQGGYPKKDPVESQLASVQASLQQLLQYQTTQSQNFTQMQQFQAFQQNQNLQVNEALAKDQCSIGEGEVARSTVAKSKFQHASIIIRRQHKAMSSGDYS